MTKEELQLENDDLKAEIENLKKENESLREKVKAFGPVKNKRVVTVRDMPMIKEQLKK